MDKDHLHSAGKVEEKMPIIIYRILGPTEQNSLNAGGRDWEEIQKRFTQNLSATREHWHYRLIFQLPEVDFHDKETCL